MHFLVVVDYYLRYPEVKQLTGTKSTDIVLALKGIFSQLGIPNVLVTDNGPQCVSEDFKIFSSTYQFMHVTSSPRHPQGNGLAKKTAGTVKALIKKAWHAGEDPHLGLLAYRAAKHEANGVSPGQLLMGRKLPTIASQLIPQLVDKSSVREKDKGSKGSRRQNITEDMECDPY
ncbi:uncharacterized protein K02A2.6-like [Corticium candelabrum]|uniref:uncharacterized protein K02A2.6-like n=1 Tax=Corticium candelabrum TaxID=121492 RepID=UPI002E25CB40|nr:uncharacterized protein K02A2.6-like [Corticium candelabrum]